MIEKVKYPAKIIVRIEKDSIDFSLLTIKLLTSITSIADRDLKLNECIITTCFDKDSFDTISKKGKVSANIPYIAAIRWTVQGNSGAPIGIYEDHPKVYGITRAYSLLPNERQFTYFTPISSIRPYIERYIKDVPPIEKPTDPIVKVIPGKDGLQGIPGKDGKDGINGKDGKDGINGKDGKDGTDLVLSSEQIQEQLLKLIKSGALDGYKGTIRINVKSKVITKE